MRKNIASAVDRVYTLARQTPLDYSPWFSEKTGVSVYFKLENLQHTGSFKLRGVTNKLLALPPAVRQRGCVIASSGNHGAASAFAMARLDIDGKIFLPEGTSAAKTGAIRIWGSTIEYHGIDGGDTEIHARQYAEAHGQTYISPYNDAEVIAGQGTIAHELLQQLDPVDVVFAAVGGGGLISGMAGYLKSMNSGCQVIGCLPENSAVMAESVAAGHVVSCDNRQTLSDGTAGNMDMDTITFPLCQQYVDDFVLVSEDEIAAAMRQFIGHQHMLLEGAAGVAVAGFFKHHDRYQGKKAVIVICGQNIDLQTLKQVL